MTSEEAGRIELKIDHLVDAVNDIKVWTGKHEASAESRDQKIGALSRTLFGERGDGIAYQFQTLLKEHAGRMAAHAKEAAKLNGLCDSRQRVLGGVRVIHLILVGLAFLITQGLVLAGVLLTRHP